MLKIFVYLNLCCIGTRYLEHAQSTFIITRCCFTRFRMNDVIVKVNDDNVVNVTHADAVDALKRAGTRVVLVSHNIKTLSY